MAPLPLAAAVSMTIYYTAGVFKVEGDVSNYHLENVPLKCTVSLLVHK